MAMLNSQMVISFPFASRPQAMTLQIEKIGFATPRRVSVFWVLPSLIHKGFVLNI